MPYGDLEWLALTQEETIEPDLPICDPHHHFWVREDDAQTYILKDLLADFGGHTETMGRVFDIHHSDIYRQAIAKHR